MPCIHDDTACNVTESSVNIVYCSIQLEQPIYIAILWMTQSIQEAIVIEHSTIEAFNIA